MAESPLKPQRNTHISCIERFIYFSLLQFLRTSLSLCLTLHWLRALKDVLEVGGLVLKVVQALPGRTGGRILVHGLFVPTLWTLGLVTPH